MRKRIGFTMTIGVTTMLAASAIAKLAGVQKVVAQLNAAGFDHRNIVLIAIAEIGSALLFFIPRTRILGLLLVSAFLGGAIATHLQHGESVVAPAIPLAISWISTSLLRPQLLWER
jgi:hypothetical protein